MPSRRQQFVGLGHVTMAAAVDADYAAHERAVVVLFAVRDIDPVAIDHGRGSSAPRWLAAKPQTFSPVRALTAYK